MSCHCWKDKGEWAEEEHGFLSPEHLATFENGATCMLETGHEGPHEWTPDSGITVSFSSPDDINCEGSK